MSVSPFVRLSVASLACLDLTRERKERLRKPKIGRMEAHHTNNQSPGLFRGPKVKVTRSRGLFDSCCPIRREKSPKYAKIGRKVTHLMCNKALQIQGQKSKVKLTRMINAETESVSPIRTPNLVDGRRMRYQLPLPDLKACEVWLLQAGGSIPCRPHPVATQLV